MKEHHGSEELQRRHYDSIASEYEKHYGDAWSAAYRDKFINAPLFENVPLSGMKVVDGMCGNGETTGYLLQKGALITAIDISGESIQNFRKRWPQCDSLRASILSTGLESEAYDVVVVVGGLHHLHPELSKAIEEVHRLLKPGGYFCFMEPHMGSLPDVVRQFWYKRDKLFVANEAAIDMEALKKEFSAKFEFMKEEYKGNVAYLLVLQSMVFRIPLRLKPFYAPALMWVEFLLEKIQGKRTSCFVVSQWRKR